MINKKPCDKLYRLAPLEKKFKFTFGNDSTIELSFPYCVKTSLSSPDAPDQKLSLTAYMTLNKQEHSFSRIETDRSR